MDSHDPALLLLLCPRGLNRYDKLLRVWMVKQFGRLLQRGPEPYPPAVLRYKVLRLLLRYVTPEKRYSRQILPLFLEWAISVSNAVAGADDEWRRIVCAFPEPLACKRFELEQWGESNSDDSD